MSDSASFLLVTATPKPDKIDRVPVYLGQVLPVLMAAGGKPIGRFRTVKQFSGSDGPKLVALFEFSSSQAIQDTIASDAFHDTDHLRDEIFERIDILECAQL